MWRCCRSGGDAGEALLRQGLFVQVARSAGALKASNIMSLSEVEPESCHNDSFASIITTGYL